MEMDSVQLNHNGDCSEDLSTGQFISPESLDMYDVFRETEELPRVGDQYQAAIPPHMTLSDYLRVLETPTSKEINAGGLHNFSVGLSISVMWINNSVNNSSYERTDSFGDSNDVSSKSVKSECIKGDHMCMEPVEIKPKFEPMDFTLENGMKPKEAEKSAWSQNPDAEMHIGKGCFPVPGSSGDRWSEIEEDSFLLGLYIFGKNLSQVKRFIESKQMGDILSYYYGKFYGSIRYRRWAKCRKMKNRKCIYGQKIFTGSRQQELFTRLTPYMSEECQITLREVSKTFGEGKLSLEEYVSTLKAIAGLKMLTEAVGVGKGKHDLTGIAIEQPKSNHIPHRTDIPIGKACSMLTTVEIMNFLTGDFRLSKARTSDLFWEAVWPRLLARGWHSEQPKSIGYTSASKHSLVFLVPGIKKFSRRKLVKGNHYFDSVSDVLSKVSSDPGLLKLDNEDDKGDAGKEEHRCITETNLEEENFPDRQQHYLKPKSQSRARDSVKFTVVDTSLANGGTSKVRQVKSLLYNMITATHSKEDESSSDDSTDESDSSDSTCYNQHENSSELANIPCYKQIASDRNNLDSSNEPTVVINGSRTEICGDMQPRKALKSKLSQKMESENENHMAPAAKRRRRLTACNRTDTKRSPNNIMAGNISRQEVASFCSDNFDFSENILSRVEASTSSSNNGPNICNKSIPGSITFPAKVCHEQPQPRLLIDLNLPVPQESESDGPLMFQVTERQENPTTGQPDELVVLKSSIHEGSAEPQPSMNSRRQSTRNRPPTARALEALACGFLSVKQKRKSKNPCREEKRPSPCTHANGEVAEKFGDIMDFKLEGSGNGMQNDNDIVSR